MSPNRFKSVQLMILDDHFEVITKIREFKTKVKLVRRRAAT